MRWDEIRGGTIGIAVGALVIGAIVVGGVLGNHDDDSEKAGITETTSASVGQEKEEKDRHLASFVIDDTQMTWRQLFARAGKHYEATQLVLYRNETSATCGFGQTATGPFFCPSDDHVYIDLSFNDELAQKLGAKAQPAQAYVLAHEVGHHVQKLLGATAMVKSFRRNQKEGEDNANVRLELQADCFAGVWARSTDQHGLLEEGDIDAALTAASAVGADRGGHLTTGHVEPETFTHGTADQRRRWFRAGFQNGSVDACDTFSSSGL